MANKPIVSIPVDATQFQAFYDLFKEYEAQVEAMPDEWKKQNDAVHRGAQELYGFKSAAHDALTSAADSMRETADALRAATDAQKEFFAAAGGGDKTLKSMAKSAKALGTDIFGIGKHLTRLGVLGLGGITSAVALARMIDGSVNTLASSNVKARELNLPIGAEDAFSKAYERFDLSGSDLHKMADVQADVTQWGPLISAGMSSEEIQKDSVTQLTADFAQKASTQYASWMKQGMPALSMAHAYGFDSILSRDQLQAESRYHPEDWSKADKQYQDFAKRFAVDQNLADQSSQVKAALGADWQQVLTAFNTDLAKAGPELLSLADAATKAAVKLLDIAGPQVKEFIDAVMNPPTAATPPGTVYPNTATGGFKKAGDWLRGNVGGNFPGNEAGHLIGSDVLGMYLRRGGYMRYMKDHNISLGDVMSADEKLFSLPPGILSALRSKESSNGKKFIGLPLKNGQQAVGDWQMLAPTMQQYLPGGDRVDPLAEAYAESKFLAHLSKKYNGDIDKMLAAHNWGEGNLDRDINGYTDDKGVVHKGHGDQWEQFAPSETQDLIKVVRQLISAMNTNTQRQSKTPTLRVENHTAAQVSQAMNAAKAQ